MPRPIAIAAALAASLVSLGLLPASSAAHPRDVRRSLARPTDGPANDAHGLVSYTVPEATPYDTPHFRVHYVADPASVDAPDLTDVSGATDPATGAPAPDGVPDYVEQVGADLEYVYGYEVGTLGFAPPPPDDADGVERGGDGRYDVYIVDFDGHGQRGLLGLTVDDPLGSRTSYLDVDDDYAATERPGSTTTPDAELRVTIAHEFFHAIQDGYGPGFDGLPLWLAEGTATWMERQVYPDITDNATYLLTLLGRGTEEPLWQASGLHVYGTWWFIDYMTAMRPHRQGWVRDLLERFAADAASGRSDDGDYGLTALGRVSGGERKLGILFRGYATSNWQRYFRGSLDDRPVGGLRVGQPRVLPAQRISGLQVRYYRLRLPARHLVVSVSGEPYALMRSDLALVVGGFHGALVTQVRRIGSRTLEIAGTVPPGRPREATLIVTHVRPSTVSYQVSVLTG